MYLSLRLRRITTASVATLLLLQPLAAQAAPLGSCCPQPSPAPDGAPLHPSVIAFVLQLQDSQPSGLVPIVSGSVFTTTCGVASRSATAI